MEEIQSALLTKKEKGERDKLGTARRSGLRVRGVEQKRSQQGCTG
jgi:hypothetical protein